MTVLRIFLILAFLALAAYTLKAGFGHGWDLGAVFFGDLTAFNWSGQFNFDFLTYLWLSALWLAWRHDFSPLGIVLALIASVGGMLFLAPYLLIVSAQADGDLKTVLLGERRARE
ncbi:MAG: hypothetical protein QNI84_10235 [Henriciella sp.]|nr:hypothetical protein [Henriciella sp.]